MNDFTKDELLILFTWGMSLADSFPGTCSGNDNKLYRKICFLIENYDEQPETPVRIKTLLVKSLISDWEQFCVEFKRLTPSLEWF